MYGMYGYACMVNKYFHVTHANLIECIKDKT